MNIKIIDVFGQFDNKGTDHYYTFAPGVQSTEWKRYINDPRELPPALKQSYALWCTMGEGWWLSAIRKNPHDNRGGWAMLSICIGNNRPVDGLSALRLVDMAYEHFVLSRNWHDADTNKWLVSNGDIEVRPCAPVAFTLSGMLGNSAFRTYSSDIELNNIFAFPSQEGYGQYARLFVVPVNASQFMHIPNLTDTIRVRLTYNIQVQNTQNTNVSASEMVEGGMFEISYTKPGTNPVKIQVKAGDNTPATVVRGVNIMVKDPVSAGVVFHKCFSILCKDEEGRSVMSVNIKNKDRLSQIGVVNDPSINRMVYPESLHTKFELIINSQGYDDASITVDPSTLANDECLVVPLKKRGYTVRFVVDGKSFEAAKSVKSDSPEYRALKKRGAKITSNLITLSFPSPEFMEEESETNAKTSIMTKIFVSLGVLFCVCIIGGVGYWAYTLFAHSAPERTSTEQVADSIASKDSIGIDSVSADSTPVDDVMPSRRDAEAAQEKDSKPVQIKTEPSSKEQKSNDGASASSASSQSQAADKAQEVSSDKPSADGDNAINPE